MEETPIITLWTENGIYGWHKKEFTNVTDLTAYLLDDVSLKCQAQKTVIYSITHSTKKVIFDGDHQQLVDILKGQMKLSPSEAKEAASYAITRSPSRDLSERLKIALQYHGQNKGE